MTPRASFDPLVARWFRSALGEPTDVQRRVWDELASGRHILACAPTGSGKTLAAFLGALNALATGAYPVGRLSVLYVSPLKALNADIRRNLLQPLSELRSLFLSEDRPMAPIAVSVRSGDTSAGERRDFLENPPEILATTPESLALLLNSPRARKNLERVRLVVLDEIHSLIPVKRGVFLMAQLERLAQLSGEFLRIGLSATVGDPEAAAAYVAGFGPDGAARPVTVVRSEDEKAVSLSVRYPGNPDPDDVSRWPPLVDAFLEEVRRNRTTLVFVNSRRHAEKIAFQMNERAGEEVAWAHHGSLSREVRSSVEDRLKRGLLKAVVATSSLELGIDIGSVDEVLLAGTPGGAAATLQRLGRAGHRVGAESRALLFPLHAFDLLLAAATLRSVRDSRLERERGPEAPLDVLAQVVLSMTAMDDWTADELFRAVRRARPFASLERTDFDLVVAMLRGRFESARLPALSPRLERDVPGGLLRAKKSVLPLLYGSGGVIADRGSFALLLADSKTPLGELDEEFVWERRIGDGFALGTRAWRIVGIDERSVTVRPSERGIQMVPFWRAESLSRSLSSMLTVLAILEEFEAAAAAGETERFPAEEGLDKESAAALRAYLARQRSLCPLPLPGRVVVEEFPGPDGQGRFAFLHTMRGGRVNAALGIALRCAADRRHGEGAVEFFWDDAGVLASFSAAEDAELRGVEVLPRLLDELRSVGLAELLARSLEATGLFGAAFRENAGRALLLPRASFGKRTPLWMTRLRSKRLYEAVRGFPDFPITRETWRVCLSDELDPENAAALVEDIASGRVELAARSSESPSPFAAEGIWIAKGSYVYRGDEGGGESATDASLIEGLLAAGGETARVSAATVDSVLRRVKRFHPDYLPRDEAELADWLDERGLVDPDEWSALREAAGLSGGAAAEELRFPGAASVFAASPDLRSAARDEKALLSRWLRYEGPADEERILRFFGPEAAEPLRELVDDLSVVRLRVDGGGRLYCDAELAARLLRAERAAGREKAAREEAPLPQGLLQALVAERQRLRGTRPDAAAGDPEAELESLREALEPILGVSAAPEAWERDILPARTAYLPYRLDLLMRRYPLVWYGSGDRRVGFSLENELAFGDIPDAPETLAPEAAGLLESLRVSGAPPPGADPEASAAALRALVRGGLATADGFGAAGKLFATPEKAARVPAADLPYGAPRPKGAFPSRARWERARRSVDGFGAERWRPLERERPDALDRETALRERARRMLARYGVLSRSIAALEEGAPSWRELFRALRLMEFSGEAVGGRFAAGLEELQFRNAAEPEAGVPPPGGLFCFCARDPASLCGLSPLSEELRLPSRLASNHLVWRGDRPVLVSRRNGRELDFRVGPDHPDAAAAADLLRSALSGRAVDPVRPFVVERAGEEPAARSAWAPLLRGLGFVESLRGMEHISPFSS